VEIRKSQKSWGWGITDHIGCWGVYTLRKGQSFKLMHARRVTGESCAPFLDSDVAISHRFLNHAATWNIIYNIYYIYIYIVGRGAFEWPKWV
jgi:hypothetical protein